MTEQLLEAPIRIETDRLGLVLIEMLTAKDDQAYFDLQNTNLEYWKKYGNTIDDSIEAVTKRRLEKSGPRFGIYMDGKLIGMEGYTADDDGKAAEVGIMMAEEAAGQGYASSSVRALTDYMKPKFDRIYAEADPENEDSVNLLKATGFVQLGDEVQRDWGRALVFDLTK